MFQQLDFDKCFYEHRSTKTVKELNTCLNFTYKHIKLIVYVILVVFLGIPFVILYAIFNAFAVFFVVWMYQPLLRVLVMLTYAFAPLVTVPLQAVFTPLVDVNARLFRQIRIKANLGGTFAERFQTRSNHVDTPV